MQQIRCLFSMTVFSRWEFFFFSVNFLSPFWRGDGGGDGVGFTYLHTNEQGLNWAGAVQCSALALRSADDA